MIVIGLIAALAYGSGEATVEAAIRGHYAAIGAGDFETAYSYFGPTFRSQTAKQDWINGEESFQITGSTINSLNVDNVSGGTAIATVDVSFQDNTGTPRFLVTWSLVKEAGQWKLDDTISGEKIG